MKQRTARTAGWAVGLWLLALAPPAFAYLDPSTGSMIISAIVGLFASAVLALKTFWYRLKGLFRRRDPERREPEPAARRESGPRQD